MKALKARELKLPDKEHLEISQLQLERAKQILKSIPALIEIEDYYSAVNRAYYAAFHAIKALEVLDNYDSKKHSGLMNHFRLEYIKTGKFDVKYSEILKALAEYRQDSDYDIFASITLEIAQQQYENAKEFVNAIEEYLNS